MKYFYNSDGKVYAYEDNYPAPSGFVELTDEQLNEWKKPKPPTIAEQIATLEASITPRNLRGAALGDQFAIDKIQAIEDEIQALRG